MRSEKWFNRDDEVGLRHRTVLSTLGYDATAVAGKPMIGICNPASDLNNCELGLGALAVISLLMMLMVVRKASEGAPPPEPVEPVEEPEAEGDE